MTAISAIDDNGCRSAPAGFLEEALAGLSRPQKQLPCKYFYDDRGSRLFTEICGLNEYYPTRSETRIMRESIGEMVEAIGRESLLIEYGSGSSEKTRLLIDRMPDLAGYVPIDIARDQLDRAVADLTERYPQLRVHPVCADYTRDFAMPRTGSPAARRVVYFPGSTIGNFNPREAAAFLRRIAGVCGRQGGLLIGVDIKKDPAIIERAYNDARGVTAQFNLNLLHRLNRELAAGFNVDQFAHDAFYNASAGRIEMHLVSLKGQTALLGGTEIKFRRGETIWTESSYKYSLDEFRGLAAQTGFEVGNVWLDGGNLFSVQLLKLA